mmetsp:Transcript_37243/g.93517  ORF Transcript_37243/g.93517 Transcript_37243/m.93517 type:complete len:249 (+) Transcript_37243:1786-2532(+)
MHHRTAAGGGGRGTRERLGLERSLGVQQELVGGLGESRGGETRELAGHRGTVHVHEVLREAVLGHGLADLLGAETHVGDRSVVRAAEKAESVAAPAHIEHALLEEIVHHGERTRQGGAPQRDATLVGAEHTGQRGGDSGLVVVISALLIVRAAGTTLCLQQVRTEGGTHHQLSVVHQVGGVLPAGALIERRHRLLIDVAVRTTEETSVRSPGQATKESDCRSTSTQCLGQGTILTPVVCVPDTNGFVC